MGEVSGEGDPDGQDGAIVAAGEFDLALDHFTARRKCGEENDQRIALLDLTINLFCPFESNGDNLVNEDFVPGFGQSFADLVNQRLIGFYVAFVTDEQAFWAGQRAFTRNGLISLDYTLCDGKITWG